MLKKIVLILFLIVSVYFPVGKVYALDDCASNSVQIQSDPYIFPLTVTSHQLHVFTTNDNVQNFLTGKSARLAIISSQTLGIKNNYSFSAEKTFENNGQLIFDLDGLDPAFTSPGLKLVNLDVKTGQSDFQEFCGGIKYFVGESVERCYIDPTLPHSVPPETTLPVKFVGKANSKYILSALDAGYTEQSATTDGNGRGVIPSVNFGNKNGNEVKIHLTQAGDGSDICESKILVSLTAPQPPIIDPAIPIPLAESTQGAVFNPNQQTKGAGILCDNNKGVGTALGCIPSSPELFITQLMNFLIGIGGGIALIIMASSAIQIMTQGADAKALSAARQRFIGAVMGLIVMILSVFILRTIGVDILQIPGFK